MPKEITKESLEEQSGAFVRHQSYLARYGTGLAKEAILLLSDGALIDLIREKGTRTQINKRIKEIINTYREGVAKKMNKDMKALTKIEIEWLSSILGVAVKEGKNVDAIIKEAMDYPLVVNQSSPGKLISGSFDRFEEQSTNTANLYQNNMIDSDVAKEMMVNSLVQLKRNLDMGVRTAAFSVASKAREAAYKANPDIIRGVVMSAILDGRTTNYCKLIDGQIFPLDSGPRPPFHPRCRTIALPVMEGETDEQAQEKLQFRASVGPGEEYEPGDNVLPSTRKNIEEGAVKVTSPEKLEKKHSTYGNFLKSQVKTSYGREFIRDTLGVARGNLFIKRVKEGGKADKVLKNVLEVELKSLNLKELRARK